RNRVGFVVQSERPRRPDVCVLDDRRTASAGRADHEGQRKPSFRGPSFPNSVRERRRAKLRFAILETEIRRPPFPNGDWGPGLGQDHRLVDDADRVEESEAAGAACNWNRLGMTVIPSGARNLADANQILRPAQYDRKET